MVLYQEASAHVNNQIMLIHEYVPVQAAVSFEDAEKHNDTKIDSSCFLSALVSENNVRACGYKNYLLLFVRARYVRWWSVIDLQMGNPDHMSDPMTNCKEYRNLRVLMLRLGILRLRLNWFLVKT